ncbi:MAG TPA: tetratricopeptide repeat protein [Candidatus Acidoferrales bacterium]|nr:tetratricopeptide repeat protein [Candidatus Acidoferrales bacterium]
MKQLLQGASFLLIAFLFGANLVLSGCGSEVQTTDSGQTPPDSVIDSLRTENARLQADNDQLTKTNAQLDQDKKALNAKVADITSKLGQSSQQWQDLQDLQARVSALDSELAVQKQINRDLMAKGAESEKLGTVSPVTSNTEFKKSYDAAVKLCLARKYKQATPQLESLTASSVDDPLMSNAHYWLGMAYYSTKHYDKAVKEFQKTTSYQKSWKAEDAYLMLGLAYVRLGDKDNARSTWESLGQKYPNSKDATQAKKYLSQL